MLTVWGRRNAFNVQKAIPMPTFQGRTGVATPVQSSA
ncbi:hypothetical protein DM43_4373 [Burkholderia cepacia]|uniref:Uncharacterized protein n=1 Tax=Burkholderia cepacia TaxID=292 RepID=A0AA89CMB5_BURCE|nr:hypothetical protein DM43_4373 [Burkholderia cepacia]